MKRTNKLAVCVTAAAVAAVFALPAKAAIYNEAQAETIEQLQNHLLELRDEMNNIQARADAEKRDLTEDEQKEIERIFAAFESTEADIERRSRVDEINAKMAASAGRRTERPTEDEQPQNQGGAASNETRAQQNSRQRASVPAQPRAAEAGMWGFRSRAEYYHAVMVASRRGGVVDPRLIANAPTTYGQEGVGADGGFAVPPDFRKEIMIKVMGEDSLLSRTDQLPVSGNSITMPLDETTPWQSSGGILAYWESEAGLKSQSKPALTEFMLKTNKVIVLVPLSDELLEDAPAMASYVNRKAPEKIDFKVNEAIIKGTGAGQPLGILNSPGTITVAAESGQAADTVRFENIVNMYARIPANGRRNAVWLMNSDAEAILPYMRFVDQGSGNAVPVYLPPGGLSALPYGTLFGRPVLTSEAMPALGDAGDIILADLSQYQTIVKSGGIRQDVSIHVYFDYDVTAFRFVLRIGGQPKWATPITRPGSQSSRSYFVALGAR